MLVTSYPLLDTLPHLIPFMGSTWPLPLVKWISWDKLYLPGHSVLKATTLKQLLLHIAYISIEPYDHWYIIGPESVESILLTHPIWKLFSCNCFHPLCIRHCEPDSLLTSCLLQPVNTLAACITLCYALQMMLHTWYFWSRWELVQSMLYVMSDTYSIIHSPLAPLIFIITCRFTESHILTSYSYVCGKLYLCTVFLKLYVLC